MAKSPPFTVFEAVLLLEYYLKVVSGELSRKEAIIDCSNSLRCYATKNGDYIDDTFRNVNGITFQMAGMESAYYGKTIMKPASKLFSELMDIYRNHQNEYKELLSEVKDLVTKDCGELEMKDAVTDRENFKYWLKNKTHLAEATVRSYTSAIVLIENFALDEGLKSTTLYGKEKSDVIVAVNELMSNENFLNFNLEKHNRLQGALSKFLEYKSIDMNDLLSNREVIVKEPQIKDEQRNNLKQLIGKRFKRGIRLDSTLELRKLRRIYEDEFGLPLDIEDAMVWSIIRAISITYEGKAYIADDILDNTIKERLLDYLNKQFEEGKSAVYFEALYKEFENDFLDYCMYDSCMLRDYLKSVAKEMYFFEKEYVTADCKSVGEPIDELRALLKSVIEPIEISDICRKLSHLPEEKVRMILRSNSEFIRNKKGEYFHADNYSLTEAEERKVIGLIQSEIELHKFVSGNELYDYIRTKFPSIYEKNACFSIIGCRDSLKYRLNDYFSFNGNIISEKGKELSMSDVFLEFAKDRKYFSWAELSDFAENLNTVVYFDALYEYAFRVSQDEFVPKEEIHFDVKKTDEAIDRFCNGKYIPVTKVEEFAGFPSAMYPWNEYLLEQYVSCKSERYCLIHGGYNRNTVVGAIVRKSSVINSLDDLIIDVLANSGIKLDEQSALDYLVSNGYIARRTYAGIETIIINAKAARNIKES